MDLARTAAIAADPDAAIVTRLDALATVVETVSLDGGQIPDAIVDAIDDLALVDGAVMARRTNLVCAALHQLGPRPELATTRRRIVRRLLVAGADGLALAGLAFEIGDLGPGATLAVRDYLDQIDARVSGSGDPIVEAWLGWLASQDDLVVEMVLRQLATRGVEVDALIACTAKPERAARLRTAARGSLAR